MAGSLVASLQSKDHKILMDTIDKLRSQGISRYVDLPQIIVCGDQSSGKSSVLQAISGLAFPIKDNLCTRFATELILRHVPDVPEKCRVSIQHGDQRSPDEKENFTNLQHDAIPDQIDIAALIEKATIHMGLGEETKTFSSDILRIEVIGPAQPNLTMVDLPGLFRAGNKDQSDEDADTVRELVRSYMSKSLSIILAVVSAKSDFALQEVTQLARKIDPQGLRTIGLVTKPDTLDIGSNSELSYLELVQNRDVKFRLGWHVLRNRDFQSRNATNGERDKQEQAFFASGAWAAIPRKDKGVVSLRYRLSNILTNQILEQLPDLASRVDGELRACTLALDKLGAPRATIEEQRRYLSHASYRFATIMKDAIGGSYDEDSFFGSARDHAGYQRRLRAVVQNTLTDLAQTMRLNGHARNIVNQLSEDGTREVLRSEYLQEVKELMRHSRGCELPGTYNPLIVRSLFREQCQPWKRHLDNYSNDILDAVHHSVNAVLSHVIDENTSFGLWNELIEMKLEELKSSLTSKTEEILSSHLSRHPITYNHYLTDNIAKSQQPRTRKKLEEQLRPYASSMRVELTLGQILDILTVQAEADMEIFASSAATDVAMKRVVDDFSDLAVEACLVSKLPQVFNPDVVMELSDATVRRITSENDQAIHERTSLTQKKDVLLAGLAELKRLSRHRQAVPMSNSAFEDASLAQGENSVSSLANGAVPSEALAEVELGFEQKLSPVDRAESPSLYSRARTDSTLEYAEEPVMEEPVAEEPVMEEPVMEEPVMEEPVIEAVPEISPEAAAGEDLLWGHATSKKDKKKGKKTKRRPVVFEGEEPVPLEPAPEPEPELRFGSYALPS